MKEYKKKRKAEEWSHDIRPTKIKKQINSSERWRGKKDIETQLKDSDHYWTPPGNCEDAGYAEYLKLKANEKSTPCVNCLLGFAALDKLGHTLYRLGYVILTEYGRDNHSCIHKEEK